MQAHPVFPGSDSTVRPLSLSRWHPTLVGWPMGWQGLTQRLVSRLAAWIGPHSRYHDPLTGLLNRAAMEARISALIAADKVPFTLLILDIDSFSQINTSAGRGMGDLLLQRVAVQLQRLFQDPATSAIARLESDEFAVLVHHTGPDLTQLIDRILNGFSRPFYLKGQAFCLSVKVGLAESSLPGQAGADYVRSAEAAVQTAKQPGQQQCVYATAALSRAWFERLQLETDFRHALVSEQLVVHYQPIIDGQTLKICGFEALVRWQHPQRGLVAPVDFISMAEQSGLIVEMGWWVMEQACTQMVAWQQQFPDCQDHKVSVNVSNQQLLHPDCTRRIQEILDRTQLPQQNLTLEITESAFIEYDETTQATFDWITVQQIGLSIDDFGTGYSSLSYLYRFPVSTVEIDRSFIQSAALTRNSGAIVEAIIALGHKLNLAVVAEGVETPDAVSWLQRHQCNQLQGFLFSRPLPVTAVNLLLGRPNLSYETVLC